MKKQRASKNSKQKVAQVREKIAVQIRRAARPASTINTHANVTKSLRERLARQDRKARQHQEWEDND
jgi:primosomal protein N''